MKTPRPPMAIEQWPARLEQALEAARGPLRRAMVLHQTDSTQDAARRLDAKIGDVVVAWRQTNGRGRLARNWADTLDQGVAMTMVVQRDRPERLAIAAALAVSSAVAVTCRRKPDRVSIKWPNDVYVGSRKIAGILIEQVDDRALVGVGINVLQMEWPPAIAHRAISIRQLGVRTDRLRVIIRVLLAMQLALGKSDASLAEDFALRDSLSGSLATFGCGGRLIHGRVLRVDPMNGLAVLTATEGEVWLPAATTSVMKE